MAWPVGLVKDTPRGRGKAWDAPGQAAPRRSVEVMFQGRLVESYEIHTPGEALAIDKVVDHLRFKVRNGAAGPGTYRFVLAGTKEVREVRLTGPGRRTGG